MRYPGDYLEIVVPLGDTCRLQGDCTTSRNLGDCMEIVVPLRDTLRIIWRLQHHGDTWRFQRDCSTTRRCLETLGRLYDHQEISGDYIDIAIPLGDSLGIIWRLQHNQEIPGDHRQIAVSLRYTLVIIWRLYYHLDIYPRDYLEI